MFSLFRRHKVRAKTKRQRIAEHAAILAFLRSTDEGEDGLYGARVIGEDENRCVVELGYGTSRPGDRLFFSVEDGTAITTQMSFEEARKNWGVDYER
jgi:hypothetical protein